VFKDDVAGAGGSGAEGVSIANLLVPLSLATSNKDTKSLIAGGGARLSDAKVMNETAPLDMGVFVDRSREGHSTGREEEGGCFEDEVK
jgi:hypothetical protein